MKKLLTILGTIGLTATTGATVVACSQNPNQNENKLVDAQGAEITAQLTKTHKGQILDKEDRDEIFKKIIQSLIKTNESANIENDTFSVNLNSLTPEQKTIPVVVKATEPVNNLPGLNEGEVDVKLNLTASSWGQIEPNGADQLVLLTETHLGDLLTTNDKNLVSQSMLKTLKSVNAQANDVNDQTFSFFDLETLVVQNKPVAIIVIVQSTEPSDDQPGLNSGEVIINLELIPVNEK